MNALDKIAFTTIQQKSLYDILTDLFADYIIYELDSHNHFL